MSHCIILYKYGKHTRNFWADAKTESEIRTVSYGPSFSPSICAMRACAINRLGKKRECVTLLTLWTDYLYCVSDEFGTDFYSH